jgi:hypothetical protein
MLNVFYIGKKSYILIRLLSKRYQELIVFKVNDLDMEEEKVKVKIKNKLSSYQLADKIYTMITMQQEKKTTENRKKR